ncbi:BN860_15720g1_1 [Zygosaccharomyces bailii CLIB 213]|uniref:BN860_15720g1_1 n=1 Tax=Zygosaccharomyces bailii (strain CLIB 213 / ATCC 58445 / CBS 680 / BCRC 21525 / NBRC 1098 / NCYC 1416 / NRRL Y-2227) TaxID=1333698 RepID=A0A8J2T5W7_ZYGB2|nr:BN860_15720g1_1 [Zygosaccharomyces bailii CLIB 213]
MNLGKRDRTDEEGSLKRHKHDDNIDAALLNEGEPQGDSQQYETAATAAAVAHAAYGDLIQHPGEVGKSGRGHGGGAGDEEEEEDDDEEEEELDDQIKDPDHVPEEDDEGKRRAKNGVGRSGSASGDMDLDEADDDDEEKKMFGRRSRRSAPATGSDEWRKQRKDSHKEVERRRRENINTAINKLSELLPVKESSKATVLARAAEYIQKLKETESANIDKWTLQKLLSEQNQSRLTTANERLQDELGRAYKEIESLRQRLRDAGVDAETGTGGP